LEAGDQLNPSHQAASNVPVGLANSAPQLAAVSAFLGGFAAALLAAVIFQQARPRLLGAIFLLLIVAASSFAVSALAATMIFVDLQDAGSMGESAMQHAGRALGVMNGTFVTGMVALLTGIASIGWIRSRRMGLLTSLIGLVSLSLAAILLVRTG